MKIQKQSVLPNLDDLPKVKSYINTLDRDINSIFLALANRIRFNDGNDGQDGENVSGQAQVVTSGVADTEFSVSHDLGVAPIGFLVLNIDKAGVVYDSGTSWTSSTIYLKCSTATTAITLFLLK